MKSLKFEDKPDYEYLRRLFRDLFAFKGYTDDNIFDWDVPQPLDVGETKTVAKPPSVVSAVAGAGSEGDEDVVAPSSPTKPSVQQSSSSSPNSYPTRAVNAAIGKSSRK